uniref:Uncharacterized protein n=1 Tax=Glossina austeni TaxID=7395 RepID=A0A1A9UX66_GLOAU
MNIFFFEAFSESTTEGSPHQLEKIQSKQKALSLTTTNIVIGMNTSRIPHALVQLLASEAISVFSSLSFDDDDGDDDDVNVASRREFSKLRAPIEKKLSNHCLSSSLNSDATDVDDVSISSSEIS